MDAAQRLMAIEEIKALKSRYCRVVDTKQWDAFEQLFTPDATFEAPDDGLGLMTGARPFTDHAKASLDGCVSIHQLHTAEIDITGPDTANGIFVMQDILNWEEGAATVHGYKQIIGWGHYRHTFRKIGGVWRIATWKLTRQKMEFTKQKNGVRKAAAAGQKAIWS